MRTLAAFALGLLFASCDSSPVGLKVGDEVTAITLERGQVIYLNGSSSMQVKSIDGDMVTFSAEGLPDKRVYFGDVEKWW